LFALCSQVQVFIEHPESWAKVLGAAIPQTSNFFLNYIITRAFMLNFVRLLMPREYLEIQSQCRCRLCDSRIP
jgi:hypothetical protein